MEPETHLAACGRVVKGGALKLRPPRAGVGACRTVHVVTCGLCTAFDALVFKIKLNKNYLTTSLLQATLVNCTLFLASSHQNKIPLHNHSISDMFLQGNEARGERLSVWVKK